MNVIGYFKEYYKDNKFIGKSICDKDRDKFGYIGKQTHVASSDIKVGKNKIKKSEEYFTILYPLNGR